MSQHKKTLNFSEKEGMRRVCWEDIRAHIARIEPKFFNIVDALSPDHRYPLYIAQYPYGSIDADTVSSLFPDGRGNYYRIGDAGVPRGVLKDLGYSAHSTPLAMVLDKALESYIDFKHESITIPWIIYTPGKIFPFSNILNKKTDHVYNPYGLLSSTAGARSVFMLPNIGCTTHHANLQRDFNIQQPVPKSLYDHGPLFGELVNGDVLKSDWRCAVMYFSESWIQRIHQDKSWGWLKQYLHELAWYHSQFSRNRIYYEIAFSLTQRKRNLKPNPYLVDTAKHLFAIASGAAPGYIPAVNEELLPLKSIQAAYSESYGLTKYYPTVMHPRYFNFGYDESPIYYSLQNPTTHVFSPASRKESSILSDLRELAYITKIFSEELCKTEAICGDTIIGKVATHMKFNYFHNKPDPHRVIQPSTEIQVLDKRFKDKFAEDATFVRGCVSIHQVF